MLRSTASTTLLGSLIGTIVALLAAWLLLWAPVASAVPGTAYIYRGMYPEPQSCYP